MYKVLAPVAGLVVFVVALWTMPTVWAQSATPVAELSAGLTMVPVLGDIILHIQKWLPVVFQVIGAFAMIAAMTANETDDKVVNIILKVVNLAGMNFGTAKNDSNVGVNRSGTAPRP
jgi:hypothetical protein